MQSPGGAPHDGGHRGNLRAVQAPPFMHDDEEPIEDNNPSGEPKVYMHLSELKKEQGAVSEALRSMKAGEEVMKTWSELVAQEIVEPEDDGEFA